MVSLRRVCLVACLAHVLGNEAMAGTGAGRDYRLYCPVVSPRPSGPPTDPTVPPVVSPDGRLLAHSRDGTIFIRDHDLAEVTHFPLGNAPIAMAFTRDGADLLVSDNTGAIVSFAIERSEVRWRKRLPKPVLEFSFSPDGKLTAAAGSSLVYVVALKNGNLTGETGTTGTNIRYTTGPLKGQALPCAHFVAGGSYLGVVDLEAVRFLPVQRGRGLRRGAKERVIPCPKTYGGGVAAGVNGLIVCTREGVYLVSPKRRTPKKLCDTAYGHRVLPFGKTELALCGRTGPVWVTPSSRPGRSMRKLDISLEPYDALCPDGLDLFRPSRSGRGCILRRIALRPEEKQVQWTTFTRLLRGSGTLWDGCAGFINGSNAFMLWKTMDESAMKLIRREGGTATYEVIDKRGPFIIKESRCDDGESPSKRVYSVLCYSPIVIGENHIVSAVKGRSAILIVERETGRSVTRDVPERLPSRITSNGVFVTLTAPEAPSRHTVYDAKRRTVLGSWTASSPRHLAVKGDGTHIVRVEEEGASVRLLCQSPKNGRLWAVELEERPRSVSLSRDGALALAEPIVVGVDTGDVVHRLKSSGAFSRNGKYILCDSVGNNPACVLAARSGKVVGRVLPPPSQGGGDIEIVSMSGDCAWLLVRRPASTRAGDHWIYHRE